MSVAAPFLDAALRHPLSGMPLKDRQRYSFLRAVRAAAGVPNGETPNGVEGEVSAELRRHAVPGADRGGLLLPVELFTPEERTLTSTTLTKGAEAIRAESGMIDLLAPRSVLAQAGANIMAVSGAPLELVVVRGGPTIVWVSENPAADVADSDLTFGGMVNATPKTALGNVTLTRQLIQQSSQGAERVVRRELGAAGARAIDASVFHGRGAAGEPAGLYSTAGVPTVDMSSAIPTHAKVLDLASPVMDAGSDPSTMSYIAAPTLASVLQRTPRETGGGVAIWERGQIGDFPAFFSGSLSKTMNGALPTGGSSRGLCFGAWSDLLVPVWAVEIIADPYSKKRRGLVEIALFLMADVVTQHPESFSVALNSATS